ncbi:MAG: hemerythrin domain-containing protein [Planctomycetota bacterium]
MTRFDIYTKIHKAIRAALFDAHVGLGRTDFTDAAEAEAFAGRLDRLCDFLDEHAAHEDEVLLPALAGVAPLLHADLRSDHARLDGLQNECRALADRLAGAGPAERAALGRRLHVELGRLVAAQLGHMEREEVEGHRALWASFDDATLLAFHGRILAAIPGPRMAEWLALMLPTLNRSERAEVEAALAGAPA